MKKLLLVAMVAVGFGSVAACNRDATPGSPNRTNPGDRSAPPRAQNQSPSSAAGGSGAQNTILALRAHRARRALIRVRQADPARRTRALARRTGTVSRRARRARALLGRQARRTRARGPAKGRRRRSRS